MTGDKPADFGTGYYRSKDPIKNLKIKVKLNKVTGSSLVPSFNKQEEEEDGGGPSALEMRPLGSRPSMKSPSPKEDEEEYVFSWQQKLFSRREVQLYSNRANCTEALEERYHQDITALKEQGGRKTRRLFSYVDSDRFTNNDEQILATSSPNETPSFLTQKMQNVRRRKLGGQRDSDRGYGDASRRRKTNLVVKEPTEEHIRSAHVLDTPEMTMYIMADLGSFEEEVTEEDEYVLCTIKTNGQGVTSLTPDLTRHKDPYIIVTNNARRDSFQYTLTLASQPISWREQDRENKMYQELYQRHSEYIKTFVGQEFEMVPDNMLRLMVLGEIISAKNYEYNSLYVHYFVELPKDWSADRSQEMAGVTQTCQTKEVNKENIAYFSHPFDIEMFYKPDELEDNEDKMPQWPQIFVEVLSIDSWHRYRTEGYGYIAIPSSPGTHVLEIQTWRPVGRSIFDDLRRFFIGGSPELEDPTYVSVPTTHDGKILSRFGFRTETTGSVTVKLHVMQQSRWVAFGQVVLLYFRGMAIVQESS
ncbi:Meckel syndrome type 1 protein [Holothuria leucospilota]|uniref:Meckel syndrome type 1 protein n=1 Tax=Holothuria leucospilota TaxID=206669 RepID=A0A9Q1HC86_HOLLE|nr:Meckel syndrome type 1 protein [Holothuria leucospilota]